LPLFRRKAVVLLVNQRCRQVPQQEPRQVLRQVPRQVSQQLTIQVNKTLRINLLMLPVTVRFMENIKKSLFLNTQMLL
jgi:hypothetical protein